MTTFNDQAMGEDGTGESPLEFWDKGMQAFNYSPG